MHQLSEILLKMIKIKIIKIKNIDIWHLEFWHLTFQKLGHLSCQDFWHLTFDILKGFRQKIGKSWQLVLLAVTYSAKYFGGQGLISQNSLTAAKIYYFI